MATQDYDLSTLTNLRINNRKAHQRLFAGNDDSFDLNALHMSKPHNNEPDFRRFTSSPKKPSLTSSRFNDSPQIPRVRNVNLRRAEHIKGRDFDSSLLGKENLRYLDDDYYTNGSKQNDIKRERFLDNLYSSRRPTSSSRLRSQSPSPLKPVNQNDTEVFQNLGFRPRNRDIKLPDLKLRNQLRYNEPLNHIDSPIKSKSKYDDYLDNKIDNCDYEKDTQRLNKYDERFNDLIDKYKLNELTDHKSRTHGDRESQKLNETIVQLEDRLRKYRSTIKDLQTQLKQESYSKRELQNKLNDAEKYNEFLETNFDMLYQKFHKLRLEKASVSNPKKQMHDLRFDITDDTFDMTQKSEKKDEDSTTLNLMNFKARSNSP